MQELESVDDWIMEHKAPLWEHQNCAVCFCPIDKDGDLKAVFRDPTGVCKKHP